MVEIQEDTFFLAEPFDKDRRKREKAVKMLSKKLWVINLTRVFLRLQTKSQKHLFSVIYVV